MAAVVLAGIGLSVAGYKHYKDKKAAKEAQQLADENFTAYQARNAASSSRKNKDDDDASSTYSGETLMDDKVKAGSSPVYEMPAVVKESRGSKLTAKVKGLRGERLKSKDGIGEKSQA